MSDLKAKSFSHHYMPQRALEEPLVLLADAEAALAECERDLVSTKHIENLQRALAESEEGLIYTRDERDHILKKLAERNRKLTAARLLLRAVKIELLGMHIDGIPALGWIAPHVRRQLDAALTEADEEDERPIEKEDVRART